MRLSTRLALLTAISLIAACSRTPRPPAFDQTELRFVGTEQCASCHQTEFQEWRGSHHQLAMQVATAESVLGDFGNASLEYNKSTSRFLKDGARFVVETGDETGELKCFRRHPHVWRFTFAAIPRRYARAAGNKPFPLPGTRARRTMAVNVGITCTRTMKSTMRIRCTGPDGSSTGTTCVPSATQPTFRRATTWNQIRLTRHMTKSPLAVRPATDPGPDTSSRREEHRSTLAWGLPVNLDDRANAAWIMDHESGIAKRSEPNTARQQTESCGRCHSRRSVIAKRV